MAPAPVGGLGVTAERLRRDVLLAADEISDPCSVATGVRMGLVEMGIIRESDVIVEDGEDGEDGATVSLTLRLTAPGCLYYVGFERDLQLRVGAVDGVREVTVRRDPGYDWQESDIAEPGRLRLREHRLREHRRRALQEATATSQQR